MKNLTLSQRLTLVFASLLLLCCALSGWIQFRSSIQYGDAMIQNLSRNLADNIAHSSPLMNEQGINQDALKPLFDQMMAINPSVEVYLLDKRGHIIADAAPKGHLKRPMVDIAPLNALLAGEKLPVYGDDPRNVSQQKIFSVAPLNAGGKQVGYLYVILQGEHYNNLNMRAQAVSLRHFTYWSIGLIALFGLVAGGCAFHWVTRPIRQLTAQVSHLDRGGVTAVKALAAAPHEKKRKDEVTLLRNAFIDLAQRIAVQWEKLASQDQQRREFIANISHDLRTPLMSLHGYLETLSVKAASLKEEERTRYLNIALMQSHKVGQLSQQLFELARLEYGVVKPRKELFSLYELIQDVFQKFELSAETRKQRLVADIQPGIPHVKADLSMMERVLTNLIDNAIKHTPEQGVITLRLWTEAQQVMVQVKDSGPGIPQELKADLFERPSILGHARRQNGGLGLMIVRRILQLHGSDIALIEEEPGACFRFGIPL
ncbi:Sensor histidine kinase CssS [Paramixta manurensis]|uniref:histidine kinase n=1 Tax=Paramixta manurensis TaxID=2740817 RepID=A0A6M8U336_9GAMM|nr:Sensor histidine kinase CssS [Erwiniaceae bacterium PD-1]